MFQLEDGVLYCNESTAIVLIKHGSVFQEKYILENLKGATWAVSLGGNSKHSLITYMSKDRYMIIPENEGAFEVIVGNIGTVYSGPDEAEARKTYREYCEQSNQSGRASGEDVTLLSHGEPIEEFEGSNSQAI